MINIPENLDRLMKERYLTLSMTASRAGVNKSTLHNYLNGVSPQGIGTLEKLALLFEVPINEILYGKKVASQTSELDLLTGLKEGTYEVTIRFKDKPSP